MPNNASIGTFEHRWAWIMSKQWPAWQARSSESGNLIDLEKLLNSEYKKR